MEKQPSPATEASWAWGGNEPARGRQLGCGLCESPAVRNLGGGLRGKGPKAGVRMGPSKGWVQAGCPEPESEPLEASWEGVASRGSVDPLTR